MTNEIVDLARRFYALKTTHAELKTKLDAIDKEWVAIENELMEAMVEEGVSTIKVDDAGKFTLASEHYFSATVENKPEVFEYLKKNGHGALIKEDVNARTLSAFCKNMLTEMALSEIRNGVSSMEAEASAIEKMKNIGFNYFRKRTIRTQAAPQPYKTTPPGETL